MRAIYFDMDGTIADLFGYENWLDHLHNSRTLPYADCAPLVDPNKLRKVLNKFKANGYTVGVISWGAMGGSVEYTRAVKRAKIEWLNKWFGDTFTEIHVVKYGTPKHTVAKIKNSILVDDNADVRAAWKNGTTIDATNCEEMMKTLAQLAA